MTPATRKIIILVLFLAIGFSLRGQNDSLVIDSITGRIKEILDEYNSYSAFFDTLDYVNDPYIADDLNLQTAASHGACNEIIRLFVKGADVNNYIGRTASPLHYAVSSGKWEAVEILLLLGANPDMKDMYGNTALVTAVRADKTEIAEKIIRYGGSVTEPDRQDATPLHHSAALGNFRMTDMLLYYDSPTEFRDREGNTPLMAAVFYGFYDIADLLLQAGADPNADDKLGFTPIMAAAQNGDTLMMRILTDAGAWLYAVNDYGLDALGCAIVSSKKDAVAFLLEEGNLWRKQEGKGISHFKLANTYGNKELADMLSAHGLQTEREVSFNQLSVSAGVWATTHYQLSGVSLTISDPGRRAGIIFGAAINPLNQRLLIRENDELYSQYRGTSNVIYTGLMKEFPVSGAPAGIHVSFAPSLSVGYRFHSQFEGTGVRPDNSICIMPAADIRFTHRNLGLVAGVAYINMPFYKVGPVWLTLKASYRITRSHINFSGKKDRIYKYHEQN